MRIVALQHEFVDLIPDDLEEGKLYISIPYATVVHKCCSGCGEEVVTPLGPTDWQLIFDGESVSLTPSIGNWSLPCRSHYWIRRNHVVWSARWTATRIAAVRAADRTAKEKLFARQPAPQVPDQSWSEPLSTRLRRSVVRVWEGLRRQRD